MRSRAASSTRGVPRAAARFARRTGKKGKALFHPIRVALTGRVGGPELDLAVPAIDRGAGYAASAGVEEKIIGCRGAGSCSRRRLGDDHLRHQSRGRGVAGGAGARDSRGGGGDKRVEEILRWRARRRASSAWSTGARAGGARRRAPGRGCRAGAAADYAIDEIVEQAAPEPPLIVVLDGIEDPHNIGAVLRSVDAAGAHGVVRQARHAAPLDGVAMKASAGARARRIATVVNIARASRAQGRGGLDGGARRRRARVPTTARSHAVPTALRGGGRRDGLRRLVRERCDRLASIPMRGSVGSLNVSVAAGGDLVRSDTAEAGGTQKIFVKGDGLRAWHGVCYNCSFVWAGVAQSGRAADL